MARARPNLRIQLLYGLRESKFLQGRLDAKQIAARRPKKDVEVDAVAGRTMKRERLAADDHVVDVTTIEALAQAYKKR